MELDGFLRAHAFLKVERPPLLWEVDCPDVGFVHLLGELIVVGLGRGNELADLTLNVSNVEVEPASASETLPEGRFVAITIAGGGEWSDGHWTPGETAEGLFTGVDGALRQAGSPYAYSRNLGGRGSITAFLPVLTGDSE